MKKFVAMILMLCIVAGIMLSNASVFAQESGVCGDNITWTLDDNGALTISGNGAMYDYPNSMNAPFAAYHGKVKKIIIEDGITRIGDQAFFYIGHVDEITIPKSVKELGLATFALDDADFVYYNAENCIFTGESTGLANNYFPHGKHLVIGKEVKQIGENVFLNAEFEEGAKYETVTYAGSADDWKRVDVNYTGNDVLQRALPESSEADAGTDAGIKVLINNRFLQCDQPPVIKNDRTLVPMRAIFEALGAEVSWNDETKTAEGVKDGKKVAVTIDENAIAINDEKHEIDVPAQLVNDRTMVPVRAISEAFDCIVQWNGLKKYVIIIPKNQTPYKISVDMFHENIATVYYNDMGLISRITYPKGTGTIGNIVRTALMPFYLNMSGNAYFNIFGQAFSNQDGIINFNYSDDKLSSIEYNNKEPAYTDNIEYVNGAIAYTYNDDNSLKGYSWNWTSKDNNDNDNYSFNFSFNYSGNTIVSGIEEIHNKEIYNFNEDGLLSGIDMKNSDENWSFTYNDGHLASASKSYASVSYNRISFSYDGQNISTALYYDDEGRPYDITYQYSDDV